MQGQQKLKGIHLLVEDLVEIYQQSSEKGNADRDQIFEQLKLLNSCIEDTTSQLWLNQLFIVKPNMASQLIGSLHQFLIKKRSVEAKQEELDALSKIKNHKKRDSVQSELKLKAMVDDSSAVKAVKKQCQQLFSTISELAQPYRSQSQLASGPSQDIHTINQYSKDVFKTVSQRYFKRNIAILTVAMVGLLVSAATLTVTYLLNIFLMSYFIVSISLMAISLALLMVNGFNMFRAVKKIQRVSESEIVYHEANQRVEEYDDEIFYSISLDDPKAEDGSQERSHQLVSLRLLCLELQAIYAFKASNSTYSQDRLHSISVNEKKIQSYIDALLKSLEADLLNKSWLDHFVKTHPKIISPLLQSMHQVVKKRHQQDIYIHKQLTLSPKGDANYIEALSNTSHEVSTLEEQLGELTSTLNRKFLIIIAI